MDTGVDDAAAEEEAVEAGTPEEGAAEGEAGAEADVSDAGDEEGGTEAEGEEEGESDSSADEGAVTGDLTAPDSTSDSTLFDQEVFDEFVTEGGDSSRRETGTGQDDDTTTELTDPLEPEPIEPVVEELPPDNPPQAGADEISVNAVEATDLTDLLLANDADPDENQSPTVSGFDATGTLGTVTLSVAEGRLFYVADNEAHLALAENETSTDLFRYTVTSGDLTATATVTLTITGVNDAPTSENRTITIEEDRPYRFSAADFAFADLDTGAVFDSVVITGLPTGGTLSLVTTATASEGGLMTLLTPVSTGERIRVTDLHRLQFTPQADANSEGIDSITFRVSDGALESDVSNLISFNVLPRTGYPEGECGRLQYR